MAKMYRVYSIVERAKQDDYWLNLGVAFPHDGGPEAGLNIILQALPLPNGQGQCKLVLRPYDPEKAKAEEEQQQASVKKKERVPA